ncbi:putative nuclease HARBI1 [Heterodontus francisci]|uniref:putative nuclease HARBI1 n=1 Tax=Heterodontus francisci TaxID=7792 RepID=UPI00355BE1EA
MVEGPHACTRQAGRAEPNEKLCPPNACGLKISMALNFYTSGSLQGSTGDMCGISQSATHYYIKMVINAIFKRASQYVKGRLGSANETRPKPNRTTPEPEPNLARVQGVINCTHVAMKAPTDQAAAFINSKGFHSLKIQLICHHRKQVLQDEYWVIRATHAKTWLLMHVRTPNTDAEERYNTCHWTTRANKELTIGFLKMRFRCLDRSSAALQYAPAAVSCIVVVCCSLHNLALQRGEQLNSEDIMERNASYDDEEMEEDDDQC